MVPSKVKESISRGIHRKEIHNPAMVPKCEEQNNRQVYTTNGCCDGSASHEESTVSVISMQTIKLEVPFHLRSKDETARKEWFWENHKQTLMNAISIQLIDEDDSSDDNPVANRESESDGCTCDRNDDHDKDDDGESCFARKRLDLLDKVALVQSNFLQSEGPKVVYTCLLNGILELMQSEFGFIGEVKYNERDGSMSLQTHATTTVGWEENTIRYFHEHPGVTFYNMDTLMGKVLTSKKPIICNDATIMSQLKLPGGHPPVKNFLGIPLFEVGGKIIGNICIANKRGHPRMYTEKDIEFLKPFTITGSNLIQAYWQVEKNNLLINTLEEKVKERTMKLEKANENLEEANRRVLQYCRAQLQHFACASHEIRTPLNCIVGLSSLLLESPLTPAQEDSMRMIVTSGDLLLTVVNDVLDYSKLECGNVDIEIRHCSLQEVLNSTVNSIETKAHPKNIEIKTFYDVSVPEFIDTDSRRLQQILYNLFGNAVKFSNEGGVIELTVTRSTARKSSSLATESSETCLCKGDSCIKFEVKDYGKGIERKDFERIFEPFSQATAETERVYGGTGLGLAITAKLVNAMGGTISVDSVVGEWTSFTVHLPLKANRLVDIGGISKQFEDVVLLVVDPGSSKEADQWHRLSQIFQSFQVTYQRFHDLKDVEARALAFSQDKRCMSKRYICLIHEDMYDPASFDSVSGMINASLSTFGPKYAVNESMMHYKCLLKILPSVLMKSLAACCLHTGRLDQSSEHSPRTSTPRPRPSIIKSSVDAVPIRDVRVLIAEDNVVNQKVLVRMLKRLGTEFVDVVDNGQKAVDAEAMKFYDLILMDLQMPVMDGIEACRLILSRDDDKRPKPKVVFVTAHAESYYEDDCRDAGAIGFLPKPYNLNDLAKCFQDLQIATSEHDHSFGSLTAI